MQEINLPGRCEPTTESLERPAQHAAWIPGLRAAFDANQFGQATPTTALYLYHGVHEQNLPIADADKFVETYRRAGANVTYRRLRFGEHTIVALTGVPGALRFLSERFGAT